MVVHSISATATPPRPSASLAFRMKRKLGGGGGLSSARRALSALGDNNALANLKMAESLLTISQDNFMKKWNFDPVKEAPVAPGRFQWASVSSEGAKPITAAAPHAAASTSITANRDISTCFTLPSQDLPSRSRVPEPHSSATVTETDSGVESDDSIIEDLDTTTEVTTSAATKQTNITDFLHPRKRLSSHLEDSLPLPASKKRLLLAN